MTLTIGVLKEYSDNRVAITPDNIKRSKIKEATWWIESGAGRDAGFEDQHYSGLATVKDKTAILKEADVIVTVFSPSEEDLDPD